jgi:hypothetical protein
MKKLLLAIFLVITMLFIIPWQGYAVNTGIIISAHYKNRYGHGWRHPGRWRQHHHGSHFYWRGTFVIPWQPYGFYAAPPVIIQQQPPVYVQPEQEEENYWYYCPDPQGYYPYIQNCPSGWMKVVPDTTPPNP